MTPCRLHFPFARSDGLWVHFGIVINGRHRTLYWLGLKLHRFEDVAHLEFWTPVRMNILSVYLPDLTCRRIRICRQCNNRCHCGAER